MSRCTTLTAGRMPPSKFSGLIGCLLVHSARHARVGSGGPVGLAVCRSCHRLAPSKPVTGLTGTRWVSACNAKRTGGTGEAMDQAVENKRERSEYQETCYRLDVV